MLPKLQGQLGVFVFYISEISPSVKIVDETQFVSYTIIIPAAFMLFS